MSSGVVSVHIRTYFRHNAFNPGSDGYKNIFAAIKLLCDLFIYKMLQIKRCLGHNSIFTIDFLINPVFYFIQNYVCKIYESIVLKNKSVVKKTSA